MPALLTRLGIRGQLRIAPAAALLLTAVLGVISIRQLGASADMASRQAAETAAVEVLRDSNSRQFEGDRVGRRLSEGVRRQPRRGRGRHEGVLRRVRAARRRGPDSGAARGGARAG